MTFAATVSGCREREPRDDEDAAAQGTEVVLEAMDHTNDEMRQIDRATPYVALPEFLTPDEFRAYVGIGRSTMYDLLRREEVPFVRFGRCIRIPKTALSAAAGVK